ncbi:MAG: PfaB family protein [bacterium]|nr:PfaB family protein [bacterium]
MDKFAIIGIACLFPGAETPQQFWDNLVAGANTTREATAAQFGVDPAHFYDADHTHPDTTYFPHGGYVSREGDLLTWARDVAREALADAGYLDHPAWLAHCGLLVGTLSFPTMQSNQLFSAVYDAALEDALGQLLRREIELQRLLPADDAGSAHQHTLALDYPAAVVARELGLGGPHFALDAACASSVYAVALACKYLAAGKADLMLAGSLSAADPLFVNLGFAHLGAYPEKGRGSHPLDASSDGLVSSEGAGMFVLKRYQDALRDGDRIYALVSGYGLTNDGRGKHVLQPNSKGQVLALERAFARIDLAPGDVQYIECHASGTPLGDKTELNSMEQFFTRAHPNASLPRIGSVKANVGHLLTAAGIAAMLKVILGMQHGLIPATPGVQYPLSSQGGSFGGAQIVQHNLPWNTARKVAGINAFGFGGVSAHLLLESVPPSTSPPAPLSIHWRGREKSVDGASSPLPRQWGGDSGVGMQSLNQLQGYQNAMTEQVKANTRLAVVGMDAHFGRLDGLEAYARALYNGETAFIPLPEGRWKGLQQQPELLARFGLRDGQAPQGAYIESFDLDFLHYKIPPNPADEPIPQQLLLLKVADNAIRDAGLKPGANVAVIVAMSTELSLHQLRGRVDLNWQIKQALANAGIHLTADQQNELERISKDALLTPAQANHYVSYIGNITASRVASLWDFAGPTFTISSEENSVFKALEVAQLLLADGSVEAVVVGAVDLAGGIENVLLQNGRSPVGTKAAAGIDRESDGWLVGEGAGAIVVRAADAGMQQTQNDDVYAVIDSLAIAPSVQEAAHSALAEAGILPSDVGYLELHASGIPQEDTAEIEGLAAVYRGDDPTCAIGSAKATVGHTFAAAGMASLVKTIAAISGRFIPAVPNWSGPEQADKWQGTRFWAAAQSRTWFTHNKKAAVNSLSADGTAAHVVLSAGGRALPGNALAYGSPYLFLINGDDEAALMRKLDTLRAALASDLTRLASDFYADYAADAGHQSNARYVLVLVGRSVKELTQEIDRARQGVAEAIRTDGDWSTPTGSAFVARPVGREGKVAFVYPGAFNSYPKLGYDLFHLFPTIYDAVREIKKDVGGALHERMLYPRTLEKPGPKVTNQMKSALENNAVAMVESGLSFAVIYNRIMEDVFRVQPSLAFGYSLGEGSMMWGMGVWRDGDAGSAALNDSPLYTTRLAGPMDSVREAWGIAPEMPSEQFWAAYFIAAPAEDVRAAVARERKVYLTHINTPREVMIAGDPEGCARVVAAVKGESMKAPFSIAIHNEAMMGEYPALHRLHDMPVHPVRGVTLYSAADYAPVALDRKTVASAISRMACKQVDFPRLIDQAYADGARVFIELGPRSTCARWIDETLAERPHVAVSIDQLGADDRTAIVRMLARLAAHHVPLDLSALFLPMQSAAEGKKVVRTVRLGGQDIYAAILSEENRRKFADAVPMAAAQSAAQSAAQPVAQQNVMQPAASQAVSQPTAPVQLPAMSPVHSAHTAFLQARREGLRQMAAMIELTANSGQPIASNYAGMDTTASSLKGTPPLHSLERGSGGEVDSPSESAGEQVHLGGEVTPPPNPAPSPTVARGIRPQYPFDKINAFAIGRVADCYGEKYAIYDNRRAPRIPNGDLLLVSRVVEITGERFKSQPGTSIHTEYDVPVDAWWYRDNPYPTMPYSVYMEIALQPCGFLSAHHGPTLDYPDIDFYFRNLDGNGRLHHDLDMRGRTITNHVTMLNSTVMQGIIIQKFSFKMYDGDLLFYEGEATFGYFTREALNSQAGLDQGKQAPRWLETVEPAPGQVVQVNPHQPFGSRFMRLAQGQLEFTDEIKVVPGGGKYGQGYAYANTIINPATWFFKNHFHQDPVMPGSIGVETILQAMQAYAIDTGLGAGLKNPHFAQVDGGHNTVWRYRGQILSDSEKSHVEANIKRIEQQPGRVLIFADASLWRDKLRIYEVRDIALAIVEGE